MLKKVENYIRQWKMLEKGDKVVVGLSGGADSVCLFLILEELRKKIGFEILAVHVNHGIRGEEAKADEEFVKTLCEKKEIPCRSVSVDIPKMAVEYRMSEEEAGRTARRKIFEQAAEEWGGTRIALAHHQDDNAETFFLHLARGSGLRGLGRIYQVKIEARDQAQRVIDDVLKLSVPNAAGEMVPFSSFTKVEEQLGQDQINRYNMYSTASLTCNVAPGSSTGQAIQEVEALFKEQLGDEFGYEWTSVAYQETQAGNTTTIVLVMALIVAFLVLAAQYESWTSPVAAVIGLPVALLGAMIGCLIMGTPISIYTQIGIILLVALSAKNGILIVEFARDFRAEGNSIREAAFEAGHVRLRPILMTSFAFVLGVMPLLFATGAGAQSRIALGAAVVFGMAMNTLLATIYIPNFYELMQKLQERFSKKKADDGDGRDAVTQK